MIFGKSFFVPGPSILTKILSECIKVTLGASPVSTRSQQIPRGAHWYHQLNSRFRPHCNENWWCQVCVGSGISISAPNTPGWTHQTALITYTVRCCNTEVNQFMANHWVMATRDDEKWAKFRVLIFWKVAKPTFSCLWWVPRYFFTQYLLSHLFLHQKYYKLPRGHVFNPSMGHTLDAGLPASLLSDICA